MDQLGESCLDLEDLVDSFPWGSVFIKTIDTVVKGETETWTMKTGRSAQLRSCWPDTLWRDLDSPMSRRPGQSRLRVHPRAWSEPPQHRTAPLLSPHSPGLTQTPVWGLLNLAMRPSPQPRGPPQVSLLDHQRALEPHQPSAAPWLLTLLMSCLLIIQVGQFLVIQELGVSLACLVRNDVKLRLWDEYNHDDHGYMSVHCWKPEEDKGTGALQSSSPTIRLCGEKGTFRHLSSAATTLSSTATPISSAATPISSAATPFSSAATPISSAATPISSAATPISSAATPIFSAATQFQCCYSNLQCCYYTLQYCYSNL